MARLLKQLGATRIPKPRTAQRSSMAGPQPCRFCGRISLHAVGCSRLDRLDAGETS